MNSKKPRIFTKKDSNDFIENFSSRESALRITFSKLNEILERDVRRSINKSYTQYAKDNIITYLQNPTSNLDNIREVSRFLERYSMIYRILMTYYAVSPLYFYNLTETSDISKSIDQRKLTKTYNKVAKNLHGFDIKENFSTAIYRTVRDGMYVGFIYTDGDHTFMMPLDIKYCRIYGKTSSGQWIVYFDASYFTGANSIYVEGIDGDTTGCWDQVFIDGWKNYQKDRRNAQWFRLTPERTFCMIAGLDDEFNTPLPYFAGLFISLVDLSDLEQIVQAKSELDNYKLIISKLPLLKNSENVDDFAINLELAQAMQEDIDNNTPDLVGTAVAPFQEYEVIDFDHSDTASSTDKLANSVSNLFNNAGASQLVVAGGSSTNSVGLKHAIQNDISKMWVFMNRIQSWMNFYIEENIAKNFIFTFHRITWYNEEEYQDSIKDVLVFGGSLMDYLTCKGKTPYEAVQQLFFEDAIGLKDLMKPLQTSYTVSNKDVQQTGRPKSNPDDLTEEGADTADAGKNETTRANG